MNKSSTWTALRNPAFRQLWSARGRISRSPRDSKNDYEERSKEEGAPEDPLILVAPAANLVAILRRIDHNLVTPWGNR
jgi:hypothetical protein